MGAAAEEPPPQMVLEGDADGDAEPAPVPKKPGLRRRAVNRVEGRMDKWGWEQKDKQLFWHATRAVWEQVMAIVPISLLLVLVSRRCHLLALLLLQCVGGSRGGGGPCDLPAGHVTIGQGGPWGVQGGGGEAGVWHRAP